MDPLTPDQSALAADYLDFALKVAQNWDGDPHANRSDAGWACVVAAGRWDGRIPFATYLGYQIRFVMLDRRRRAYTLSQTMQKLGQSLLIKPVPAGHRESLVDLTEILDRLAPEQDEVLAVLLDGCNYQQGATRLNMGIKEFQRHLQAARDEIQGSL